MIGLEKQPLLVTMGQHNLQTCGFDPHVIRRAGNQLGLPGQYFDRILVSAAAKVFPDALLEQLTPTGRLVIPIEHDIVICQKQVDRSVDYDYLHGFRFVPLV